MVEFLCTITGIVAGIAIVASLMQAKGERARWEAPGAAGLEQSAREQPQKMAGIADQLRLLTFRVAADVNAHSEKVEAINDRLHEPEVEGPDQVLSAIHELINVNQNMQNQLADARKRIVNQTEMIEEASQQARTDALTGLPNRRALNEFLTSCLNAIQPGECAGLLLMDIDHFKSFNDTYGHTTGDAVLSAFARNIKKACNQECYPARYGGEEFAVILTGRDPQVLAEKSASIRKYASEQVICFEDLQLKITASAGLCLLSSTDTMQKAYDSADEGLYRSKKAGRNQGFWLLNNQWLPFPQELKESSADEQKATAPDAQTYIRESAAALQSAETKENRADTVPQPLDATPSIEQAPAADKKEPNVSPDSSRGEKPSIEAHARSLGDVLDLATFMNRTAVYCEQLRRAELPATGILIEAQWEKELNREASAACFGTVLGLIQSQLRGIDVVCVYRLNTAGVFLPGCSADAAIERASRIQLLLEESRADWQPSEHCPDRLSIAVGQASERAEVGQFLQRLEAALDEAQDAGRFEFVVDDGESTRFESTIQP